MITIDDLPAWLPSWEVLLTLFLSMALIGQIVAYLLSFITIALAKDDLEHLQQPLIAVVSFIVIVTILATAHFIGTKEDSATIQPEKEDRKVITLTPEQAAEIFGYLGRVDKRDSPWAWGMIQAGICDGDQLGTRPYVGRGVGVL